MNPPSKDIAKWLSEETPPYSGLGTFAGDEPFSLYVAVEPAEPNDVVTIYDTGGSGPDTDALDISNITFQVRVRCVTYSEGHSIHEIIRDMLLTNEPVCETSTFVGVAMTTDVIAIGRDENNRHLLTANYSAIRNI